MPVPSTELFTLRAGRYAAFRPGYPPKVFTELARLVLPPATAADVGAGTGIFSRGLREVGYTVTAVEPNASMRAEMAAVGFDQSLVLRDGTGEATGLPQESVDLVTVAQAFHWLDRPAARAEFRRIGRPGCRVAVVWNTRQFDSTPFMRDYHRLLVEHTPRYQTVEKAWTGLDREVAEFLSAGAVRVVVPNPQSVTREGLLGNLLSYSYAPDDREVEYDRFVEEVCRLFDGHQRDGAVLIDLQTILYVGEVTEPKGVTQCNSQ